MPPRVLGRDARDIGIKGIGTPSYRTVDHLINGYLSAGFFEGGTITDSGSGQIDVAAVKGLIRTTDSQTGLLVAFDLAAQTDVSLTDASMNYVYVNYNSGTPVIAVTTDYSTITHTTHVVIGRVYRDGTTLYISNVGTKIGNVSQKDIYRLRALRKAERSSGLAISNPSGRYIALSAGVLFSNYEKLTTSAFDSSGDGTWITWHRNGSGGFTQIASETQVNNTQYDNNAVSPTSLTTNYYAVHWFYVVPVTGSQVHMVMSQAQYSKLIDAEAATVPSTLPTLLSEMGLLVGRAIVKQGTSTLISLSSAFTTSYILGTADQHNELSGLQGGTAGEYYHLTSAQASALFSYTGTPEQGDIIYYNGSGWVLLPHGTDGQYLKTQGHGANPTWATVSAGSAVSFRRYIEGELFLTTLMFYRVNANSTITEARMTIGARCTVSSGTGYVKVDVRKNGLATTNSIFSSDTPMQVASDATASNGVYTATGTLDSGQTSVSAGDVLYVVVTEVGGANMTSPGADLEVVVTL